jgi:hypothetical protein
MSDKKAVSKRGGIIVKKVIIYFSLMLLLMGCTLETVDVGKGNDKSTEQEVIVETVFEPRTVSASYINVEAERLNVRSDADIESTQVGAVYKNDKFQVIDEKEDSQKRLWYLVEFEPNKQGYVAGWFCAQTEITIRVEENSTQIVDIEVMPIPQYIDNPFKPNEINVGDQIVGMLVKEISQIDNLNKIVFDGEVELTGTFYHETSRLSFGTVVRFVPDEASSVLLPRMGNDISGVLFILNDYSEVANKFGEVGTQGFATMKIKDYTIGYGVEDAYNQATLVSVTIE